jgi:hypothetical protein
MPPAAKCHPLVFRLYPFHAAAAGKLPPRISARSGMLDAHVAPQSQRSLACAPQARLTRSSVMEAQARAADAERSMQAAAAEAAGQLRAAAAAAAAVAQERDAAVLEAGEMQAQVRGTARSRLAAARCRDATPAALFSTTAERGGAGRCLGKSNPQHPSRPLAGAWTTVGSGSVV